MLRLHYVPTSHGSPVCSKHSVPWYFGHIFLCFQDLLRPIALQTASKFCYVLLRYVTFSPFYHDLLRYSFTLLLPWQIFKLSKNLPRHPRLSSLMHLPFSFSFVALRLNRFDHSGISGCRDRREHSVNSTLQVPIENGGMLENNTDVITNREQVARILKSKNLEITSFIMNISVGLV